jgi:hypothetical protein
MQPISWKTADKRTYVPFAEKKYDVMIFGMPQFFHYGDGMGTNPIMLMQALSAQVIRHKRVMSDKCVIICASACNGNFHDELWPYTREICTALGNILLRMKSTLENTVIPMHFIRSMAFQ